MDNCLACHDDGQFDLPLKVNNNASKTNHDNTFTSPIATVCTSCHISVYAGYIEADGTITAGKEQWTHEEKKMIKHMICNGAVFAGTKEEANKTEGCSVCHSSGSAVGVDTIHGLAK